MVPASDPRRSGVPATGALRLGAQGHREVDALAESKLPGSAAVQADVGTTIRRWVTDQLGPTWPRDQSTAEFGAHGILDALLGPSAPSIRRRVRPFERPVSMVAATAMQDVLAAWREAERELAVTPEDSLEWPHVNARLISLRVAYRRLFDEAIAPR